MNKTLSHLRPDRSRILLFVWTACAFLILAVLFEGFGSSGHFYQLLLNQIWHVLFLTVIHFFFLEYALKWFKLSWKAVMISLLLVFIFLLIYSFGHFAWVQFGKSLQFYNPFQEYSSPDTEVENLMSQSMGSLVFFALVRHAYDYRNLKLKTQQLKIEKQRAELNYLKSQTNPHFLFNTLNNIFSLARDKSDLTAESIMRLSKIMRFMLYETSGKYISLEQELQIIEDYIALEKLRYDESLIIKYSHDIEDKKQSIPPLLLIPLVENAFKHGASETRGIPSVDIHLSVNNRKLSFIVKNSVENSFSTETIQEQIGLSNLRRQLELLYREYELKVFQKDSVFTAQLQINLATYVSD